METKANVRKLDSRENTKMTCIWFFHNLCQTFWELIKILWKTHRKWKTSIPIRCWFNLNTHSNRFYVCSDVANYTYIGDVTAPILRVIPLKYMEEEIHFHQEFLNLHYVPFAKSFIDQGRISIKGDTGEDIPFITGKTLIKSHFRLKE